MTRERIQRWSLALIGLFMLPTAIQATFAPQSWYDDFPLGRGWIGGLETVDQVGVVGSLVSIPILAAMSLWAGLRLRMAR